METANLPYNSLYFGNWVNRCIRDISPKLRCNRCSGVQVQSKSVYTVKNFSCWTHQYEGWTDTAGSKETEFTISLCIVPYRATRCIRYSDLLVLNQNNVLYTGCVQCCLLHHRSESCTQQLVPIVHSLWTINCTLSRSKLHIYEF